VVSAGASWLGVLRLAELHQRLPAYRVFVNPIRYASLGLAVCEAMALGLPIVGLATTALATVVQNGVNGYAETDVDRVVEHARRPVLDREEAAALQGAEADGQGAVRHRRFTADWSAVLQAQAGRRPLPHRRRHLPAHWRRRGGVTWHADSTGDHPIPECPPDGSFGVATSPPGLHNITDTRTAHRRHASTPGTCVAGRLAFRQVVNVLLALMAGQ